MAKPCGCPDDMEDQLAVDFKFDNTGYNVQAVVKLTEDKFVDHPMHNGNYTGLKTPERIALLRKIYQTICKSVNLVSVPKVSNSTEGKDLPPLPSPQPEVKANGPETKARGKETSEKPKIGDINTDDFKSPN